MQEIFFEETTKSATNTGRGALLRQDGRTYTIGSSASLRWVAKSVNSNAHPRILLPQNRCLPEPFAAPFPHQPEPRCNTLDFGSKVVCQRAFRRSLDSSRQGTGKWGALMQRIRLDCVGKYLGTRPIIIGNTAQMCYTQTRNYTRIIGRLVYGPLFGMRSALQ